LFFIKEIRGWIEQGSFISSRISKAKRLLQESGLFRREQSSLVASDP